MMLIRCSRAPGFCLAVILQSPVTCGSSGSNCDTSLLLLLHPVHGSSTFMSITDFVVDTGIIKDTFCKCCLTCIDMSHDTNVSGSLQAGILYLLFQPIGFSSLIRNDSEQMLYLLQPSCAYLLSSLQMRLCCSLHPEARLQVSLP